MRDECLASSRVDDGRTGLEGIGVLLGALLRLHSVYVDEFLLTDEIRLKGVAGDEQPEPFGATSSLDTPAAEAASEEAEDAQGAENTCGRDACNGGDIRPAAAPSRE